ncbi:hypothetical protein ACNHYB_07280 [Isoptericola jiangsuensis]|uniref:hypothetical protein n=1 Tax=Isoptericola jiangsuensis TaxID=548579 RepID=UPI003AAFA8E9
MITLLKHEILRTRAVLGLVTGVAVLLALAGALLGATGWPVLASLGTVLAYGAAFVLVPVAQILLAVHYWRSSYGRTGYLTQTLPVKGSTIYWSKMLWAWLVSLVGVVVAVGIALGATRLIALGGGPLAVEVSLRDGWRSLVDVASWWGAVALVLAVLSLVLIWPTQYFFAASLGSEAPLNRMGAGGPIVVWLGVYLAIQVLTFASFAAVPLAIGVEGDGLALVHFDLFAEMLAGSDPQVVPIGFLPALLLTTLVCLAWSVRSWGRRVSLV